MLLNNKKTWPTWLGLASTSLVMGPNANLGSQINTIACQQIQPPQQPTCDQVIIVQIQFP